MNSQTTEKRSLFAAPNEDDGVDASDGSDASDFDEDDEDPDKIEVPGKLYLSK